MEAEDRPGLVVHLLFVISIDQEGEGGPGGAGCRLDRIREEALVVVRVEVAEVLPGVLRMLLEVVVGSICDPLQLVPVPGKPVLDVDGLGRIVAQLILAMGPDAEIGLGHAESEIPAEASLLPVGEPFVHLLGPDEVLHLHLFELAGTEHELTWSDLVSERLAHLGDPERKFETIGAADVLEVGEDPLRRFRSEVDQVLLRIDRAHVSAEHEMKRLRLGEGPRLAAGWAGVRVLQLVETMPGVAVAAFDERIGEDLLVPRRLPYLPSLEDGRVDPDHVVPQLDHVPPPFVFDVSQ